MINPAYLRSFCALVDIGHFTRTADQLHMTQSGVSQHIRKLEEQLGEPLLVRQGKGFTVTACGDRLYREGRRLLAEWDDLEAKVGIDPAYEGVVKIASPGSVGLKLYPYLLQLQKRYPKLVIDYRFAPNSEIEKLIAGHKIDFGLMTCMASNADVSLEAMAEEELLLILPAKHAKPSWDELMSLGFIDHPDGAHHAGQLLGANFPEFQSSQQLNRTGFSNQINLILEPVSLGLGFTVLPTYAVAAFRASSKIKIWPLTHKVAETLFIGKHRNKFMPNRVATVMAAVSDCLDDSRLE